MEKRKRKDKKWGGRTILAIVLSLVLCMALLPTGTLSTARAAENPAGTGGTAVTIDCSTLADGSSGEGWYVREWNNRWRTSLILTLNSGYTFTLLNTENTSLTSIKNYGTIAGGTVSVSVNNMANGTITGGTFGYVYSEGVIAGGTFNNNVSSEKGTISGGTFYGNVDNYCGTIVDGTFNGRVMNYLTGAGFGTISGGTFNGALYSSGTVAGGTFCSYVEIQNGTVSGGVFVNTVTISDKGNVTGGVFAGETTGMNNTTYSLTVSGGCIGGTGGITTARVIAGSSVTINADNTYKTWTATGITLTDAQKTAHPLTFTMPANDVTITTVKSAAPTLTWPAAGEITYGETLSQSNLSGGSTQYGEFTWTNPDTVLEAGSRTASVTFTANADTVNGCEEITETVKEIPITVKQESPAITVNEESITANNNSLTVVLSATVTGLTGTGLKTPDGSVVFTAVNQATNETISIGTETLASGKAAVTWTGAAPNKVYTVTATYQGDTNYTSASETLEVDTARQPQSIAIASPGTKTYGDAAFALSLSNAGSGTGAVTWTVMDGSEYAAIDSATGVVTIKGAGEVTIEARKANDDTYNQAEAEIRLEIDKQALTVTAANASKTYGAADPAFSYTVKSALGEGTAAFAYSDTEAAVLTGALTRTAGENVGTYDITEGTLALTAAGAKNYTLAFAEGILTITAPAQTSTTNTTDTSVNSTASGETGTTRIEWRVGISDIPQTLKDAGFDTEEKIVSALQKVILGNSGYTAENTITYDLQLEISYDGGKTWIYATEENFPAEGVTVTLPYPSGTSKADYDFMVAHMFTTTSTKLGTTAGGIETPAVTATDEGLQFTLKGLSPVTVAWKAETADNTAQNVTAAKTGDANHLWMWFALVLASGTVCVCGARRRSVVSRKNKR